MHLGVERAQSPGVVRITIGRQQPDGCRQRRNQTSIAAACTEPDKLSLQQHYSRTWLSAQDCYGCRHACKATPHNGDISCARRRDIRRHRSNDTRFLLPIAKPPRHPGADLGRAPSVSHQISGQNWMQLAIGTLLRHGVPLRRISAVLVVSACFNGEKINPSSRVAPQAPV